MWSCWQQIALAQTVSKCKTRSVMRVHPASSSSKHSSSESAFVHVQSKPSAHTAGIKLMCLVTSTAGHTVRGMQTAQSATASPEVMHAMHAGVQGSQHTAAAPQEASTPGSSGSSQLTLNGSHISLQLSATFSDERLYLNKLISVCSFDSGGL